MESRCTVVKESNGNEVQYIKISSVSGTEGKPRTIRWKSKEKTNSNDEGQQAEFSTFIRFPIELAIVRKKRNRRRFLVEVIECGSYSTRIGYTCITKLSRLRTLCVTTVL